jgi:tetratricopeptide (TPR) repeat protein
MELVPPIKGVSCFCIDTATAGIWDEGHDALPSLCVVKRRLMLLYDATETLRVEKEYQIPGGAITLCRQGDYVCYADTESYHLLNLKTRRALPLIPVAQANASADGQRRGGRGTMNMQPFARVAGNKEFLVVNASQDSHISLGMIVTSRGEPSRGTLQWPAYPRAVEVVYPHVVALLPVDTIVVHDLIDQKQVMSFKASGLQLRMLQSSAIGIPTQFEAARRVLGKDAAANAITHTNLFLVAKESVSALYPTSLIEQADEHVLKGEVESAVTLTEQYLAATRNSEDPALHLMEAEYVYRRCAFLLFGETLFEEAFGYLRKVKLDPRLLIFLYPDVRPRDCQPEIPEALKDIFQQLGSIDDVVQRSLDANAQPEDKPLKERLHENARNMLMQFLEDFRESNQIGVGSSADSEQRHPYRQDLDTALAKLYMKYAKDNLIRFLRGENYCAFDETKEALEATENHYALYMLYRAKGKFEEALSIWAKSLEGEIPDAGFGDMMDFANLLSQVSNTKVTLKYVPWILKQSVDTGIKLLLDFDLQDEEVITNQDAILLLQPFGDAVVQKYLEAIVFIHKNTASTQLMDVMCVDTRLSLDARGTLCGRVGPPRHRRRCTGRTRFLHEPRTRAGILHAPQLDLLFPLGQARRCPQHYSREVAHVPPNFSLLRRYQSVDHH